MKVYFVRHGESSGNKYEVHQGKGVVLTKKGKVQAKILANSTRRVETY